eukprot:jgi/Mesvir1/8840/Mv02737-RA.1
MVVEKGGAKGGARPGPGEGVPHHAEVKPEVKPGRGQGEHEQAKPEQPEQDQTAQDKAKQAQGKEEQGKEEPEKAHPRVWCADIGFDGDDDDVEVSRTELAGSAASGIGARVELGVGEGTSAALQDRWANDADARVIEGAPASARGLVVGAGKRGGYEGHAVTRGPHAGNADARGLTDAGISSGGHEGRGLAPAKPVLRSAYPQGAVTVDLSFYEEEDVDMRRQEYPSPDTNGFLTAAAAAADGGGGGVDRFKGGSAGGGLFYASDDTSSNSSSSSSNEDEVRDNVKAPVLVYGISSDSDEATVSAGRRTRRGWAPLPKQQEIDEGGGDEHEGGEDEEEDDQGAVDGPPVPRIALPVPGGSSISNPTASHGKHFYSPHAAAAAGVVPPSQQVPGHRSCHRIFRIRGSDGEELDGGEGNEGGGGYGRRGRPGQGLQPRGGARDAQSAASPDRDMGVGRDREWDMAARGEYADGVSSTSSSPVMSPDSSPFLSSSQGSLLVEGPERELDSTLDSWEGEVDGKPAGGHEQELVSKPWERRSDACRGQPHAGIHEGYGSPRGQGIGLYSPRGDTARWRWTRDQELDRGRTGSRPEQADDDGDDGDDVVDERARSQQSAGSRASPHLRVRVKASPVVQLSLSPGGRHPLRPHHHHHHSPAPRGRSLNHLGAHAARDPVEQKGFASHSARARGLQPASPPSSASSASSLPQSRPRRRSTNSRSIVKPRSSSLSPRGAFGCRARSFSLTDSEPLESWEGEGEGDDPRLHRGDHSAQGGGTPGPSHTQGGEGVARGGGQMRGSRRRDALVTTLEHNPLFEPTEASKGAVDQDSDHDNAGSPEGDQHADTCETPVSHRSSFRAKWATASDGGAAGASDSTGTTGAGAVAGDDQRPPQGQLPQQLPGQLQQPQGLLSQGEPTRATGAAVRRKEAVTVHVYNADAGLSPGMEGVCVHNAGGASVPGKEKVHVQDPAGAGVPAAAQPAQRGSVVASNHHPLVPTPAASSRRHEPDIVSRPDVSGGLPPSPSSSPGTLMGAGSGGCAGSLVEELRRARQVFRAVIAERGLEGLAGGQVSVGDPATGGLAALLAAGRIADQHQGSEAVAMDGLECVLNVDNNSQGGALNDLVDYELAALPAAVGLTGSAHTGLCDPAQAGPRASSAGGSHGSCGVSVTSGGVASIMASGGRVHVGGHVVVGSTAVGYEMGEEEGMEEEEEEEFVVEAVTVTRPIAGHADASTGHRNEAGDDGYMVTGAGSDVTARRGSSAHSFANVDDGRNGEHHHANTGGAHGGLHDRTDAGNPTHGLGPLDAHAGSDGNHGLGLLDELRRARAVFRKVIDEQGVDGLGTVQASLTVTDASTRAPVIMDASTRAPLTPPQLIMDVAVDATSHPTVTTVDGTHRAPGVNAVAATNRACLPGMPVPAKPLEGAQMSHGLAGVRGGGQHHHPPSAPLSPAAPASSLELQHAAVAHGNAHPILHGNTPRIAHANATPPMDVLPSPASHAALPQGHPGTAGVPGAPPASSTPAQSNLGARILQALASAGPTQPRLPNSSPVANNGTPAVKNSPHAPSHGAPVVTRKACGVPEFPLSRNIPPEALGANPPGRTLPRGGPSLGWDQDSEGGVTAAAAAVEGRPMSSLASVAAPARHRAGAPEANRDDDGAPIGTHGWVLADRSPVYTDGVPVVATATGADARSGDLSPVDTDGDGRVGDISEMQRQLAQLSDKERQLARSRQQMELALARALAEQTRRLTGGGAAEPEGSHPVLLRRAPNQHAAKEHHAPNEHAAHGHAANEQAAHEGAAWERAAAGTRADGEAGVKSRRGVGQDGRPAAGPHAALVSAAAGVADDSRIRSVGGQGPLRGPMGEKVSVSEEPGPREGDSDTVAGIAPRAATRNRDAPHAVVPNHHDTAHAVMRSDHGADAGPRHHNVLGHLDIMQQSRPHRQGHTLVEPRDLGEPPTSIPLQGPQVLAGQEPQLLAGQEPQLLAGQESRFSAAKDPQLLAGKERQLSAGREPQLTDGAAASGAKRVLPQQGMVARQPVRDPATAAVRRHDTSALIRNETGGQGGGRAASGQGGPWETAPRGVMTGDNVANATCPQGLSPRVVAGIVDPGSPWKGPRYMGDDSAPPRGQGPSPGLVKKGGAGSPRTQPGAVTSERSAGGDPLLHEAEAVWEELLHSCQGEPL